MAQRDFADGGAVGFEQQGRAHEFQSLQLIRVL
jgi:hypothetical protein